MNLLKAVCVAFLLILPSVAKAQATGKALELSPEIGSVIDSTEKADYHLFPYLSPKTFKSAQVFKQADSSYVVKILLKNDDTDSKVISKEEFYAVKERINPTSASKAPATYKHSFYILGGVGYGTNLLDGEIDYSSAGNEIKTGGYGSGVQSSFGLGFKIINSWYLEVKADFFNGNDVDLLNNGKATPSMTRITPVIKKEFTFNTIQPYIKIGPTFTKSYEFNITDISFSNGHTSTAQLKIDGGNSIGIHSACGFSTELNKWLHFFGEITLNVLTVAPTEQKLIKYSYDGVDRTQYITNPTITLKTNPDPNDNTEAFKRFYNMSNIGFNAGLILYIN